MHKSRVWEVPITESVIRAVEALAESQGYPQLKLTKKNKIRLLPGDWDEDVEYIYDDDYEDNDENDKENTEGNEQLEDFEEINDDEIHDINKDNNL